MTSSDKVRENRLRLTAQRRGLRLEKSRRRDPHAVDFGRYWLHDAASGERLSEGLDLDGVERWLAGVRNGLRPGDRVRHLRRGDVGTYHGKTTLGDLARVHFAKLGDMRDLTVKVAFDQIEKVEG